MNVDRPCRTSFFDSGCGTLTWWFSNSILIRQIPPRPLCVSNWHFWNCSQSLHFLFHKVPRYSHQASAFWYPVYQSFARAFRYWAGSPYYGTGLVPVSTFLSVPVPDLPHARQSGIPTFLNRGTYSTHCAYKLQVKDWHTPCTFTLLVMKGGTPCTSIQLAVKRGTPGMPILLSGRGYTLHIQTAGGWKRYVLHVHTPGFGRGDTLHVHTAGCGKGYTRMFNLLAVEMDTLCTSILLAQKGIHPARPFCWQWKGTHPARS